MANWKNRNYLAPIDPPGPVPSTPKITGVTAGDTTATVAWQYPANIEDVDHWDLEIFQGAAELGVVRIEGPATRSHTIGELTNGQTYTLRMQAVNINGRSDSSNAMDVTPQGMKIPAPSIYSITAKDGYISFSFREGSPLPGTVEGHKYVAKRTDSGYEFEGDVIPVEGSSILGLTGPLDNDREYVLYLATVIGGIVGPYSAPSTPVTPSNPVPPYPPIWAHVDAGKWDRTSTGGGKGVDWLLTIAAGSKNTNGDFGPQTITGYRYEIKEKSSGTVIINRTFSSSQQQISVSDTGPWMDGIAVMTAWAKNNDGESAPTVIEFDVEPHADLPIDFGVFQEIGEYRYHVAEEDVSKWAKVNKRGVGLNLEYLVIGAGGAGHGRTAIGGTGGNGGSGQITVGSTKPFGTGPITTKIGDGTNYQNTTPGGDSNVTIDAQAYIAKGGGTATGKDQGTPDWTNPAKDIATVWPGAENLRIWFWNKPYSQNVGGSRTWDKNDAPNANLYGQGGGGTNSSGANHGGNGGPGVVVVRYKIADVPPADPPLNVGQRVRNRFWTWRFDRRVRRARVKA